MLEESIPALWSAVHGFFTPAVLFVVLNIVIGTIAVTSKVAAPAAGAAEGEGAAAGAGAAAGGGEERYRKLSRVPSMAFERLRSFNLSQFTAAAAEPAVDGVVDLGYEQPPAPAVEMEEEEPVGAVEREVEPEREPEVEHEDAHAHAAHMERSRSEAAAEAERPRLPARLHKSASDRSAFAHFEAQEVEETVRAVEARRPATTREGARRGRWVPVAEPEPQAEPEPEEEGEDPEAAGGGGGEVDALADAFINKFHHQLKLQRIDSFIRHRETLRRGQAAAGGV